MHTVGTMTRKRMNSFDETERMSPALRQCVHEYGYAIVKACLAAGVKQPHMIHQLVKEIWEGARQPTQKRDKGATLDWLLVQAGSPINSSTIFRVLNYSGFVVSPREPTRDMIDASLREVSGFSVRCTKDEKHRRRLAAALRVAEKTMLEKLAKET